MSYMHSIIDARERFRELVATGPELPLDQATLLIAMEAYPNIDVEARLSRLDAWSKVLQMHMRGITGVEAKRDAIIGFFFEELGLQGNAEDYYHPDNSFLHKVMDTRRGIPITISVLMIEVLSRCGLRAEGVGMPGHFLLKLHVDDRSFLLDPFNEGAILTPFDCKLMVETIFQEQIPFSMAMLEPVSPLTIVARMLNNLKGIYLNRSDLPKAISMVEKLRTIAPDSLTELRDYSLISYQMGMVNNGYESLRQYLEMTDDDPNDAALRNILSRMRRHLYN